jgi:hypothetical protein
MSTATPNATAVAPWTRFVRAAGVLCAVSLPVLGLLGTVLALVAAAVLASRGDRRGAVLVAGLAIGLLAVLLLLTMPVNTGELQIRQS